MPGDLGGEPPPPGAELAWGPRMTGHQVPARSRAPFCRFTGPTRCILQPLPTSQVRKPRPRSSEEMHPVHTPLKRRARIKPDDGPTELGCRSLITGRVGGFSTSLSLHSHPSRLFRHVFLIFPHEVLTPQLYCISVSVLHANLCLTHKKSRGSGTLRTSFYPLGATAPPWTRMP